MKDDDLNDRLRATFVQELEEQVRELNSGLLALEQRPSDQDRVRALFRSAHTIKGAARVAGVPVVERVCHAMESVFANLRDGTQSLTGADFSLLFATCDGLQDAAARLRAAEPLEGSVADALLPQVEALADRADGLSRYLEEHDVDEMAREARRFAREHVDSRAIDELKRLHSALVDQASSARALRSSPACRIWRASRSAIPDADREASRERLERLLDIATMLPWPRSSISGATICTSQ